MEKPKIPNPLRSIAAVMAADVLAIVGFIFLLLGVAKLVNEYIGIDGIGESVLGAAMLVIGVVILTTSKMRLKITNVPPMASGGIMMPPQPPPKEAPLDSYR